MAVYFFNIINGKKASDTDGEDHESLDSAKAAAIQMAKYISQHKSLGEVSGYQVSVTDKGGKEVFRTPLLPGLGR